VALDLKQYVVFRMSLSSQLTNPQAPPSNVRSINIKPHMAIILVHARKNIMEDVLLDGGSNVNIITIDLKKKLKLLISKPTPYTLKMANQTLTKPIGLIQDLKIHIHDIPYVVTFTAMKANVLDANYSMLLGRPWLRDAKVTHDRGNNLVSIKGKALSAP
jgi:pantoate kinase